MASRKARHLQVGRSGEHLAATYLRCRGLRLIRRNYRCRWGEVDLIMQDRQTLVFVEVRTRTGNYVQPSLTVDHAKQKRIRASAETFLATQQSYAALPCRFDVVSITAPNYAPRINWIRDAFQHE